MAEIAEQNTTSLGRGSSEEFHLSKRDRLSTVAGFVTLVLTIILFALVPAPEEHVNRISFYQQAFIRLHVIMAGVFVSSCLLFPALRAAVIRLRPKWRNEYTYGALFVVCAFLCCFVIHYGRWQYGAFDFNILIEIG